MTICWTRRRQRLEFGWTNLKGSSSTERAKALIGLAHPKFRDELTQAAKKMFLV
jgi:itaconate CoA-transferase